MTEQVDLDALEALAKAAHAEWYAKDLSMTLRNYHTSTRPEVVLALIAELRQERERADEAEREAEEITTAWLDKDRQIAKAERALSRAEEAIEKVRTVLAWAPDHDGSDPLRVQGDYMWRAQLADEALSVLTEYDKQKGADLG